MPRPLSLACVCASRAPYKSLVRTEVQLTAALQFFNFRASQLCPTSTLPFSNSILAALAKLGGNLDKHQKCRIYNYNHFRWNNKISVLEDCICATPFQVFQDTCSIREQTICSKHAGSDELGRPAVLDIFATAPLVGRILYFGMLGPQRPYVPRELVSLVVHHGGNIELNPV